VGKEETNPKGQSVQSGQSGQAVGAMTNLVAESSSAAQPVPDPD